MADPEQKAVTKRRPPLLARLLVSGTLTGAGLIGLLYLIYPSLGWVELIPDAVPFFGSLDEAGATALVLMSLSYWGMDVTGLGRKLGAWSKPKALPPGEDG